MKYRLMLAVKCTVFIAVALICVGTVNNILIPKNYFNQNWPTTNTYTDFYKLEKNTVDVLLFGSSHAASSLNPQVIYDTYGIRSYNLSCEQQSPVITYFWLREALKYQSPSVMVLDTYTFHKYIDCYVYNNMNSSEAHVHKALDCMKLSPLKVEAGMAIEKVDPTQIGLSFPLLNIRYHSRWKSLGEDDFSLKEMVEHGGIKGFTALGGVSEGAKDITFRAEDAEAAEAEPMVKIADEYLGKIVDLCRDKKIELVFINIPCGEPIERYKATKEYADAHGIPFFDFNEEDLYHEIGYNREKDLISHPNYHGAEKVSLYIGKLLRDRYHVPAFKDLSFDKSREVYEHRVKNLDLQEMTDAYQYLNRINDPDYAVFALVPNKIGECIDKSFADEWHNLGFTVDLREVSDGEKYCAAKADSMTEKHTTDDFVFSGSIRNGLEMYRFTIDTTNMSKKYHKYSMFVAGAECGSHNPGINIVVYDTDFRMIVDKVNINTTIPEMTMTRY